MQAISSQQSSIKEQPVSSQAIILASAGNKDFSAELITSASTFFNGLGLRPQYLSTADLDCGGPAIWNFRALEQKRGVGRSKHRSQTKKMLRILKLAGVEDCDIIKWHSVYSHSAYPYERVSLAKRMKSDDVFRKNVRNSTAKVLFKRLKPGQRLTRDMISIGTNYVLEEFAFVLAAPRIFAKDRIYIGYYKPWPELEELIKESSNLKMLIFPRS